jgi:polyhydroxyalkanoate synthesis regulator phasin
MRDAMRGYLNAASGLTELTRKRAQELAQSLLSATGATGAAGSGAGVAHQVSTLAEELVSAAKSNRHAVQEMIRGEVEMAVGRLGLVPASELADARRQIAELESAVAELRRTGGPASARATATTMGTSRSRPPRAAVRKSATAKAARPTAATKSAAPKKATTKKAPTKKAPTKKAPTKKAPTKKATTKKATTKKATTKKATTKSPAAKRAARTAATPATKQAAAEPSSRTTP